MTCYTEFSEGYMLARTRACNTTDTDFDFPSFMAEMRYEASIKKHYSVKKAFLSGDINQISTYNIIIEWAFSFYVESLH